MRNLNEVNTEMKKILPRLKDLGYPSPRSESVSFRVVVRKLDGREGEIDMVQYLDNKFAVPFEHKRFGKNVTKAMVVRQVLEYARALKSDGYRVPLAITTNGFEFYLVNTHTGEAVFSENGTPMLMPTFNELQTIVEHFEKNPETNTFNLQEFEHAQRVACEYSIDQNILAKACNEAHSTLRNIEHLSPQEALSDFANFLDLKLYQDDKRNSPLFDDGTGNWDPQYTFAILASSGITDTIVKERIRHMWDKYKKTPGIVTIYKDDDVLFHATRPQTYKKIIELLSRFENLAAAGSIEARGFMYNLFLASFMRGKGLGEFFTPRPIVKFINNVMQIKYTEKVLDKCCGSAGFLRERVQSTIAEIEARRVSREEKQKQIKLLLGNTFGDEKNRSLMRIARTNMHFGELGMVENLFCGDSLYEIPFTDMDVQMENPPFGKKAGEIGDKNFWQSQGFTIPTVGSSQILFIQRQLMDAKPDGGRVGTIIDGGVLNGSSAEYVSTRKLLLQQAYLVGVINLPVHTFSPYGTGCSTSILLYQRKTEDGISATEQPRPVFMARIDDIGYDKKGEGVAEDDLPYVLEAFKHWTNWHDNDTNFNDEKRMQTIAKITDKVFFVPVSEIIKYDYRFDVNRFDPIHTKELISYKKIYKEWVTLGELEDVGEIRLIGGANVGARDYIPLEEEGHIQHLRTANCRNGYIDFAYGDTNAFFLKPKDYGETVLGDGDVILCKKGASVTGRVDLFKDSILTKGDCAVANQYLMIIRVTGMEIIPEYLYACLKSPFSTGQIYQRIKFGTDSPEIPIKEIRRIEVPLISLDEQEAIALKIRQRQQKIVDFENEKSRLMEQQILSR